MAGSSRVKQKELTVKQSEELYFRDLAPLRQLHYLERAWGAIPSASIDLVLHPKQGPLFVAAVKVLNPLLQAELGSPEPVVFTRRVSHTPTLNVLLADALIAWTERVEEAMR